MSVILLFKKNDLNIHEVPNFRRGILPQKYHLSGGATKNGGNKCLPSTGKKNNC